MPRSEKMKSWKDALSLLEVAPPLESFDATAKRTGFMRIQKRPPTCLKPARPNVEPAESDSKKTLNINKCKHNKTIVRAKRLKQNITNSRRTRASFNAKLNGISYPRNLSIIDRVILQGYENKLREEQQRRTYRDRDRRSFGAKTCLELDYSTPYSTHLESVKASISKSMPQLDRFRTTKQPLLQPRPQPRPLRPPLSPPLLSSKKMSVLAGKVMNKTEAELLQKVGIKKVLIRKRREQMEKFGRSNTVLAQDIGELQDAISKLTLQLAGGVRGGDSSNISTNDYTEYMKIPKPHLPTFDISPIKKIRNKKTTNKMLSLPTSATSAMTTLSTLTTSPLKKMSTASADDLTLFKFARNGDWATQKHTRTTDLLYDLSKDTQESFVRMPLKSPTTTPLTLHVASPSQLSTKVLRGILRTASTAGSSRRVSFSPLPYAEFKPPPPVGPPPPLLYADIPSTAEMGRRAMSRRSEFRQIMGRKTGPEIQKLKAKRRMSTLAATARAIGRMKMAEKREKKKQTRAKERRKSLLGQFVTSNL
jgi:hypothetical protein